MPRPAQTLKAAGLASIERDGIWYVYARNGRYLGSVNPNFEGGAASTISVFAGRYSGLCGTWGRAARVFAAVRDGAVLPDGFLSSRPTHYRKPRTTRKSRKKVA